MSSQSCNLKPISSLQPPPLVASSLGRWRERYDFCAPKTVTLRIEALVESFKLVVSDLFTGQLAAHVSACCVHRQSHRWNVVAYASSKLMAPSTRASMTSTHFVNAVLLLSNNASTMPGYVAPA
jgi:hypothetical protein